MSTIILDTVRCLVPISGGKDSQASLKLALDHFKPEEIRGLFCDTKFEHPLTYAHVEKLKTLYGDVRIDRVCGGSVEEKSLKYGRFPGGGARHCTDELKIRETRIYCKALALDQACGFEVWYGMRLQESAERKKRYAGKLCEALYPPHEVIRNKYPKYLARMGVMFRLCVLDWSEKEIIDFVGFDNLNPLYHAGFPRVGCFPCQASGDKWKEKAYQYDDFGREQFKKIRIVSIAIGKPMFNSKGGKSRNPDAPEFQGCAVCSI